MVGKLILVPTPIGNIEDITLRALKVLKEVDFIYAEDTRHSRKLLDHYEVNKPLMSLHQHNEHKMVQSVVNKLKTSSIAYISDAGTPGISDPGFLLVRECLKEGIEVECLPGATAFVPALVISGIPCDRFYFEGFLPQKKGRKTKLEQLAQIDKTIVLYESPHRIVKLVKELKEYFDENRQIALCKEISKLHETVYRGNITEVLHEVESIEKIKGEFVVVIEGLKN